MTIKSLCEFLCVRQPLIQRLQNERDEAEIHSVLWALKLRHRTRDLEAETVRLRDKIDYTL